MDFVPALAQARTTRGGAARATAAVTVVTVSAWTRPRGTGSCMVARARFWVVAASNPDERPHGSDIATRSIPAASTKFPQHRRVLAATCPTPRGMHPRPNQAKPRRTLILSPDGTGTSGSSH